MRIYIIPSRNTYDLFIICLPFALFKHRGNICSLSHFGTLIPKFSKKISSNTKTASKFFMDPDVRCNAHKNRIHVEIHISILTLVPSDFHWFRVSTCPSFNNTDFVICLGWAAPYNKLSKKIMKKSTFIEFYWTYFLCCRKVMVLSWPS